MNRIFAILLNAFVFALIVFGIIIMVRACEAAP
jgi:hypothetical protein